MTSCKAHLLAACGATVAGGVCLAFSATVMPASRSRSAAAAIVTKQRVNVAVVDLVASLDTASLADRTRWLGLAPGVLLP